MQESDVRFIFVLVFYFVDGEEPATLEFIYDDRIIYDKFLVACLASAGPVAPKLNAQVEKIALTINAWFLLQPDLLRLQDQVHQPDQLRQPRQPRQPRQLHQRRQLRQPLPLDITTYKGLTLQSKGLAWITALV